jgi:signal transduction histidine kinase
VREHPGDPLSVVLIDDTPDIRLLLRMALEAGGRFRVVAEAGDGAAGVGEVARSQPDVVLVDLAMPVLDGLDALPALRRVCPAARIVVLSGFDSSRLLARTSAAGADGYLQKGLDPWDLEERLLRIAANAAPGLPAPRRRPPADLLERAPFGVLTLGAPAVGRGSGAADRPVRVLGANAAARELLGADRTEDREVHLPAELAAVVRAHTAALLAGGEPIEVDVPAPAGTLRVTLAPAPHGVAAYLVPARGDDSTWLRGAVAGAVHEIRNPAVVIAGVVAALLAAQGDGAPGVPREDLLQALARQARLLDRATGDLLAAAQAQRGALHVEPRPVVLADVLASAVADAPGREHVTLDCPPRLAVHADPERIQQMVHNLLVNAAKYGSPPVRVRADPGADGVNTVRVTVSDAGPGVPADLVPALFEEFSRGQGAAAPGAGLGLSVVRSLARAQGGRAWYEPGGSGAVFVFTLPAAPPPQAGLPGRQLDAMGTAR